MQLLAPEELAWQAGMFEGEGSVRINSRTVRNMGSLLADMVNVQPEVTRVFADAWGGYHRLVRMQPPRRDHYRWRLASLQAAAFLRAIQPYLHTAVYRERVALGLEYQAQKIGGPRNRTEEYAARQQNYYLRMKALNQRGC